MPPTVISVSFLVLRQESNNSIEGNKQQVDLLRSLLFQSQSLRNLELRIFKTNFWSQTRSNQGVTPEPHQNQSKFFTFWTKQVTKIPSYKQSKTTNMPHNTTIRSLKIPLSRKIFTQGIQARDTLDLKTPKYKNP